MKTAVEWLIENLEERGYIFEKKENIIIEQAKEIEKRQIIQAWELEGDEYVRNGKDYYEVTFKK